MKRVASIAAACLLVAAAGCGSHTKCYAGPFHGTRSGPASYEGTSSSASTGLAGSSSLRVAVDDTACIDPDGARTEPLTFTIAPGCVLSGRRTSTHTYRRCTVIGHTTSCQEIFVDGTAEVGDLTTPESCELPVAQGTMTFNVHQGTAHVAATGAFELTLSGQLVTWQGVHEQDGYVSVKLSSVSTSP